MSKVLYGGWAFPAGERHLPEWMKKVGDRRLVEGTDGNTSRLLYQGKKYRRALEFARARRTAIDIGGHIGLWSWPMSMDFDTVHAFEPMPEHRECFEINVFGAPLTREDQEDGDPAAVQNFFKYRTVSNNVRLHAVALGEKSGEAFIRTRTKGSSGDTGVDLNGVGIKVPMETLDHYQLRDVDFIKCDCEGFELFVMRGGVETLTVNNPVVIVEQKPEVGMVKNYNIGATDAVEFLKTLGYVQRDVLAGDYIMTKA